MSALGIVSVQIIENNKVTSEHLYYNKWSSQFVTDLLTQTVKENSTTFYPNRIYLSSFSGELSYTQTSTSVFSGYINTSFAYTTSSYAINYTDACYESSAELNSSSYPCIMRNYLMPWIYTPDTTGTTNRYDLWDSEAFWVYEIHCHPTYLSAALTGSETVISVYDASGFKAGEYLRISDFKASEVPLISSIDGNNITLGVSVSNAHEKDTTVVGQSMLAYTKLTTLTSAISAGVNIIPVVSESGFSAGNRFMLYDVTNKKWEGLTVDSVGTNQILITGGITNSYISDSVVLRGFLSAHAGDNYTITKRFIGPIKYLEWILTDTDATGYGTTPFRTLAITNSGASTIYASILLPSGIYKDSSSNIKTVRIGWWVYLKGT